MDVIHLRNGRRHGPEFGDYGYKYNRMWTNGSQTGAKYYYGSEPDYQEAPFFDEVGLPNWTALYNWCDYVPYPSTQHRNYGNTCTYDPAVDELTK